jgi:hypothetical protein
VVIDEVERRRDIKLDSFARRLFRSAQQKQLEIFETDQKHSRIQTDSARPPGE